MSVEKATAEGAPHATFQRVKEVLLYVLDDRQDSDAARHVFGALAETLKAPKLNRLDRAEAVIGKMLYVNPLERRLQNRVDPLGMVVHMRSGTTGGRVAIGGGETAVSWDRANPLVAGCNQGSTPAECSAEVGGLVTERKEAAACDAVVVPWSSSMRRRSGLLKVRLFATEEKPVLQPIPSLYYGKPVTTTHGTAIDYTRMQGLSVKCDDAAAEATSMQEIKRSVLYYAVPSAEGEPAAGQNQPAAEATLAAEHLPLQLRGVDEPTTSDLLYIDGRYYENVATQSTRLVNRYQEGGAAGAEDYEFVRDSLPEGAAEDLMKLTPRCIVAKASPMIKPPGDLACNGWALEPCERQDPRLLGEADKGRFFEAVLVGNRIRASVDRETTVALPDDCFPREDVQGEISEVTQTHFSVHSGGSVVTFPNPSRGRILSDGSHPQHWESHCVKGWRLKPVDSSGGDEARAAPDTRKWRATLPNDGRPDEIVRLGDRRYRNTTRFNPCGTAWRRVTGFDPGDPKWEGDSLSFDVVGTPEASVSHTRSEILENKISIDSLAAGCTYTINGKSVKARGYELPEPMRVYLQEKFTPGRETLRISVEEATLEGLNAVDSYNFVMERDSLGSWWREVGRYEEGSNEVTIERTNLPDELPDPGEPFELARPVSADVVTPITVASWEGRYFVPLCVAFVPDLAAFSNVRTTVDEDLLQPLDRDSASPDEGIGPKFAYPQGIWQGSDRVSVRRSFARRLTPHIQSGRDLLPSEYDRDGEGRFWVSARPREMERLRSGPPEILGAGLFTATQLPRRGEEDSLKKEESEGGREEDSAADWFVCIGGRLFYNRKLPGEAWQHQTMRSSQVDEAIDAITISGNSVTSSVFLAAEKAIRKRDSEDEVERSTDAALLAVAGRRAKIGLDHFIRNSRFINPSTDLHPLAENPNPNDGSVRVYVYDSDDPRPPGDPLRRGEPSLASSAERAFPLPHSDGHESGARETPSTAAEPALRSSPSFSSAPG